MAGAEGASRGGIGGRRCGGLLVSMAQEEIGACQFEGSRRAGAGRFDEANGKNRYAGGDCSNGGRRYGRPLVVMGRVETAACHVGFVCRRLRMVRRT